jgi:hypothetical protein
LFYGALDVSAAFQVYVKLTEALKAAELEKISDLEMSFMKVLADMELNGIYLNPKQWLDNFRKTLKKTEDLKAQLLEFRLINWDSWQQVLPIFKELGVDVSIIDKKTGEIRESVAQPVIEKQRKLHTILDIYLQYKKVFKESSTYGEKFLRHVNPTTQRVHSSYMQIMRTGRTSSTNPNCYSKDTEIMTDSGWVRFDNLKSNHKVAQWENNEISFVEPLAYVRTFAKELTHLVSDKHIDLLVTHDHRCLLENRKTGERFVKAASDFVEDYKHLQSGFKSYGKSLSASELLNWKLALALQADGHISKWGVSFVFKRLRKVERLKYLLSEANIPFTYSERISGIHRFYITSKNFAAILSLLGTDRTLPFSL